MTNSSLVSPSSAYRWLACSGSVQLQQVYPTQPQITPQAEYGSRVHKMAQSLLTSPDPESLYVTYKTQALEEAEEAWGFYQYITQLRQPYHQALIEERQTLSTFCPNMKGTPDVVLYSSHDLHIVDLKTGATPVSSENNPQLMMYSIAIMANYNLTPDRVYLHIYQSNPRLGNNTNVSSPSLDHLESFRKVVRSTLSFISRGLYMYSVGDHCTYCPAQPHCPLYSQYLYSQHALLQKSNYHEASISNTPLPKRAQVYSLLKSLEPLKEALAASLLEEDPGTLSTYGLQVKTRKSPSRYEEPDLALQALLDQGADIDQIAPRSLESPAKLKKISKAYHETIQPYLQPEQSSKYLAPSKVDKLTNP